MKLDELVRRFWGHGCGQVVSVLTIYCDDPSLNPDEAHSISVRFVFENNENKQQEAGICPLKTIRTW